MNQKSENCLFEKIIGFIFISVVCLIISTWAAGYVIFNYMMPNTQAEHSITSNKGP